MIKYYCGNQYPVVSLSERLLMTLSCKYVDDVVIGAPFLITKDLVKSLNLKKIINVVSQDDKVKAEHAHVDQFAVAKELGLYVEISYDKYELTVDKIAARISDRQADFETKVAKKTIS